MKKLLITISAVVCLTLALLFVFRCAGNAEEIIPGEGTEAVMPNDGAEQTPDENAETIPNEEDGASDTNGASEEEFNIYAYIKEKIVPVVVGVLTAASALIATLAAIKRSLNALAETRANFKKESEKRDEELEAYKEQCEKQINEMKGQVARLEIAVDEIKEATKGVPGFEKTLENASTLLKGVSQILTLGFSANKDVIKTGKGRKMELLLNSIKAATEGGQNEAAD